MGPEDSSRARARPEEAAAENEGESVPQLQRGDE